MTGGKLDIKESAVKEKRIWVRLTRRCNNGCLFCLDSDSHDGSAIAPEAIDTAIRRGREEGGQRLILSGGEPTIHPQFIDFVRRGRELGYTWLQTVTNGRMFAYKKFAEAALAAGLNEATFSMHGHTPELHDRLVGVNGAFGQALRGMRRLLGRMVVNVDVVLSKLNIPHLKEILEFYMALGITEFDLLHMIPFGRAWSENRETLFYDPVEMLPHLNRAFALRHRPGIIMWTNRLPAPFLEGNEDLIQDPHKIHDEVRGRREMFAEWLQQGIEPMCLGDRCGYCPMDRFCAALRQVVEERTQPPAATPAGLRRYVALGDAASDEVAAFLQDGAAHRVHVPAEQGLDEWLAAVPAALRGRIGVYPLAHEYLSQARARDLHPDRVRELAATHGVGIVGFPPCLGGPARAAPLPRLPAEMLAGPGEIDFVGFTDWFIASRYFVKSLRCRQCVHDAQCRGIHINAARNFGLKVLRPCVSED